MDTVIKLTKAKTGGKKSKRRDARPARKRYWARRVLEERKIANLMQYCGMSRQAAYNFWHKGKTIETTYKGEKKTRKSVGARKGRVPDGYLRKTA